MTETRLTDLTQEEFRAMARELQAVARAHPINILERVKSGAGPPLAHRRTFRYHGQDVCVLLTENTFDFPAGTLRGVHLSVAGLPDGPPAFALQQEIRDTFFPGCGDPQSVLSTGIITEKLLTMPSMVPGCTQYVVFTPLELNVEFSQDTYSKVPIRKEAEEA